MVPFDVNEIERTLCLFHPDSQVFEVRILDARNAILDGRRDYRTGTIAGYFDDPAIAAEEIPDVLAEAAFSGVYFTLNPVNPALLARATNRLRRVDRMPLTSDADVLRRRWIPMDVDPVRPAGISSTDEEKAAAMEVFCNAVEYLMAEGWGVPVIGDSGNGFHGLWPVDLPVADGGHVSSVLAYLSGKFSTERAKIDVSVYNPARIWKLYGTLACKGDSTADRPHRIARLV